MIHYEEQWTAIKNQSCAAHASEGLASGRTLNTADAYKYAMFPACMGGVAHIHGMLHTQLRGESSENPCV